MPDAKRPRSPARLRITPNVRELPLRNPFAFESEFRVKTCQPVKSMVVRTRFSEARMRRPRRGAMAGPGGNR
jgi:hypothetical protein